MAPVWLLSTIAHPKIKKILREERAERRKIQDFFFKATTEKRLKTWQINLNAICFIGLKSASPKPSEEWLSDKIGILAMSFFQKGFSPLEVTLNYNCSLSAPQKKKNTLYTTYVGSTFWCETELKYHLQSIWKIRVANLWRLLFAGGKLILFPTYSKQSNWQTAESLDVRLRIHRDQFCICQPASLTGLTGTLPEHQQANNR